MEKKKKSFNIPKSLTASVWESLVPREISTMFTPFNADTKVGLKQSSLLPKIRHFKVNHFNSLQS